MSEFQPAVLAWMLECFGETSTYDKRERAIRFLEEAIELIQTCSITADQAHALVDYVYNREVGQAEQEVGGVMVTLAALCAATSIDLTKAANTELTRIADLIPEIQAKQLKKPRL
jgi:mannose/cellobiose epimerase-like protein (N-acyl-D-glucosamine 2-epimerase family)